MKAREQRRRVTTQARMRTNAGWSDVTIGDTSSRGLGVRLSRSSRTPNRGEYVELCRHQQRLVGRVMWQDKDRFGVMLSEPVAVGNLLSSRTSARPGSLERRRQPRPAAAFRPGFNPRLAIVSVGQNSSEASRLTNFAAVAAIACAVACIGAIIAASLATNALSGAMGSAGIAMAGWTQVSID
jgi:hypothetical protein